MTPISTLAFTLIYMTNHDTFFDASVIKERAGCFEVRYQFFDHTYPESDSTVIAKEFIDWEEIAPHVFSLQHVSIGTDSQSPESSSEEVAIHWRELWSQNPKHVFAYDQKRVWNKVDRELAADEWSYSVFQIDGSLRFQNIGKWAFIPNQGWSFATSARAPLPRRESLAQRPPSAKYDWIERDLVAIHKVFGYDEYLTSRKMKGSPEGPQLVSSEVGTTRFVRIPSAQCQKAQDLLRSQRPFWDLVNKAWEEIYERNTRVELMSGRLIGEFIQMADDFSAGKQPADLETVIKSKIRENLKQ